VSTARPYTERILEGLVLNAYRLAKELGKGGMGTVYVAEVDDPMSDLDVGEKVAIKVVHPHLLATRGFFKRFLLEAELGRKVEHENVVRTLDADAIDVDGKVVHYLVMEYVEGQTLRGLLRELAQAGEGLCRRIAGQVARALEAIHAVGAIHRDLKPENVLITDDEVVKVMDLGVARLADTALRLSQTVGFAGSIPYAAPEQFQNADVDGRADLYALGLVLYELAAGQHPFPMADPATLMHHHLNETPRPLGELNPQVTPFLEELVRTLLAKKPEDRIATATATAEILEQGEDSEWWQARAVSIRQETKRPLRRLRIPRETALYGRDAELDLLHGMFRRASAGEGRVVLLEGEAGIGKSRLVDEFVGRLQQEGADVNFLFGGYPPGGAATAAGAFTEAYREHLGVEDLDASLKQYLKETPLLATSFGALLRGEPAPAGHEPLSKDSLHAVFVQATRALAAERPTVVLIDDLHFAPQEGRAIFAALAAAAPEHPLLLIGTMRRGVPQEWIANLERLEHCSLQPLARLGPKDLARLLVDAFRSERLAEDLAFNIARKTDGNPFFVFEIIRGLKEGRFITKQADGTWTKAGEIAEITIPSSVMDLIHARLDVLGDDDKDLLDLAACCGFEFDPLLVAAALGKDDIPVLRQLSRIERTHRLVRSVGRRYRFDHHQIQEALYRRLPVLLRERYHAAIADALEAHERAADKDPAELKGAVALDLCTHNFDAGRGETALRYLDSALNELGRRHLNDLAADLSQRALETEGLLAGRDRAEVLLQRRKWLDLLGRREEERKVLDEALRLADELDDLTLRARVRLDLGAHCESTSNYPEATGWLTQAEEFAHEDRDLCTEAGAARKHGMMLVYLGRYPEAREALERARELYLHCGDTWGEAAANANLGLVQWYLGHCAEARECFDRQLAYFREAGDGSAEARAVANIGFLLSDLGRQELAWDRLQTALGMVRARGDRRIEAWILDWLAQVAARREDFEDATRHAERALEIRRVVRDRNGAAETLVTLGRIEGALGKDDEATEHLTAAMHLAREMDQPNTLAVAAALHGLLPHGTTGTALEVLQECEPRLRHREKIETRFALWKVTKDRAHLDEAHRHLEYMREHAPEKYRASLVDEVPLHREIAQAHAGG